jgi:Mrp family chromosome partitioning ATPase
VSENLNESPRTLSDYLAVLSRRKWTVLAMAIGVPLVAVGLMSFQKPVYEARAEVLLNREDLAAALSGVSTASADRPERYAETQARLARTPEIARTALGDAGLGSRSFTDLLSATRVEASLDSDILSFFAQAGEPAEAVLLTNAYAGAYAAYVEDLGSAPLARAIELIDVRLAELRADNRTKSTLYLDLLDEKQRLQTFSALRTAGAIVTQPAESADKIRPRPILYAALGTLLGILLGLGLAFVREALDKRLRSPDQIAGAMRLPLLAKIPRDTSDGVIALENPTGADAEAYRMLRLSLEFAAEERKPQVIMVTSALGGEGKSTVASNLAVTLARRGTGVILIDADVHQPSLKDRFSLPARPGLIEVVRTPSRVDDTLTNVPVGQSPTSQAVKPPVRLVEKRRASRGGRAEEQGRQPEQAASVNGGLQVMTTKPATHDATEALLGESLERVLDVVRQRAELILVDAPPLTTSVGMALGARADALLVVSRLSATSRPVVDEMTRALASIPTFKLGVVVTGTPPLPMYRYATGQDSDADEPSGEVWTELDVPPSPRSGSQPSTSAG